MYPHSMVWANIHKKKNQFSSCENCHFTMTVYCTGIRAVMIHQCIVIVTALIVLL